MTKALSVAAWVGVLASCSSVNISGSEGAGGAPGGSGGNPAGVGGERESGASGGARGSGGAGEGGDRAGASGTSGAIGGGGSGVAGGGAGGTLAGAYAPCPPLPAPCRIMPSGDSITVGAQSTDTGGYRVPLFQQMRRDGVTATFVGPSGAGPATVDGVPFPEAHDGHSGYIIDTIGTRKGLTPLMAANLETQRPHIVLLMIGTNDVNSQVDLPNAPARLAALIDLITTTAPDTLLVVAQITPTRTDALNLDVQALNATIPAMVDQRVKAGKHILTVDLYRAFTTNPSYQTEWMFDGLHPNDAGYAQLAKVWYAAIREFLH